MPNGWCIDCGIPLEDWSESKFLCDDRNECQRRNSNQLTLEEIVVLSDAWTALILEGTKKNGESV